VGAAPSQSGAGAISAAPWTRDELEAVRRREPAALGRLFDRHFGNVYGLLCRLLGDRTAAEDVTQDVFLKVYRSAHLLDPARDPGAWLTVIATNACRDRWRSGAYRMGQRSTPVEDDPESGLVLTRGTNDPEEDALAAERERLVQGAIGRLPEALRVPVLLHDYQGLSHQEIAGILGVNHAAARKRYSRALAALAGLLAETLGERTERDHA
jgi:RNA polymerase sigma-70 factor (ECF subfamily)